MSVLAEVVRSGFVEGRHHGSLVVLDPDGRRVLAVGRPDAAMLPRSSLKPLQAQGMLAAGLHVTDTQLAIVCASHSGEPRHVEVVTELLTAHGLTEDALDNTPYQTADGPSRVRHNCSGKHAGMVSTCVDAGWPVAGYRDPDHPLQQAVVRSVEAATGDEVTATVVDGCGAPMVAVTLAGLARGIAALRGTRIAAAMRAEPFLVGGTGRDVTDLIAGVDGLVAKDGAEGVYVATCPAGTVAVKIDDGAPRARIAVLVAALRRLGLGGETLDQLGSPPVLGHGDRVGEVRAVLPD